MNKHVIKFGVLSIVALLVLLNVSGAPAPSLAQLGAQSATPASTAASASQDVTFPELTGPYKVGRTAIEMIDQSRDEVFASAPGLKRDLVVYLWYPASVTKRTKLLSYMDSPLMWDIASGVDGRGGHPGLGNLIHTHAYSSELLATDKPSYPVLIFEPGFEIPISSLFYASITEELASHGYVVVGMSHPYASQVICYPDGRILVGGAVAQAADFYNPTIPLWTQDARFVLDQLERLNATNENLKGHLDLAHVGMLGHSSGGKTSISAMAVDPRIKAGAALVGADKSLPKVSPFLYVVGGPNQAQQAEDTYLLVTNGTLDTNYTDIGLLVPLVPDWSRLVGTIDPAYALRITNSYLVTFFDHYLKGADLKWPSYPEAKLTDYGSAAN